MGRVYPRGCGGTLIKSRSRCRNHPKPGLSPRVRGNPIPIIIVGQVSHYAWVYPRGCGGTFSYSRRALNPRGCGGTQPVGSSGPHTRRGLSPRVRGNL